MTVVTYVDDTLTSTYNLKTYEAFIAKLNEKFEVSHEEDATSFLGALITYNRQEDVLILSQEKFTYEGLRNFSMENATPISTPMDSKIFCPKNSARQTDDKKDPKTVKSYRTNLRDNQACTINEQPRTASHSSSSAYPPLSKRNKDL